MPTSKDSLTLAQKSQLKKAEGFKAEAAAKLNERTWFSSSTEQKYEDAADLYLKAANAYKVGTFPIEAAQMYSEAADIYLGKLKQNNEASRALMDAGNCYKKSTSQGEAVVVFKKAIDLLCDAGRLTPAAKVSKEIAEIFEGENSIPEALECYEQAAELFTMEDAKSHASACTLKVAELCSSALDPPDFIRASNLYEEIGKTSLDNALLKYNAKGYFLQCILCQLANGDSVGAGQCTEKFSAMDMSFRDSREGKFCVDLVSCVEEFDPEGFATVCFEYDRISKLDAWKTSILYKIKLTIMDQTGNDLDGISGEDGDIDLT